MKYTLLELVQRILESTDSDEVNSISDTTESLAVANIIKECYYEIVTELEPRETDSLFHLDASTDDTKPVLMTLPNNVVAIDWLKYNIGDTVQDGEFRKLWYLPLDEFINHQDGLDLDESWVESMSFTLNGQTFTIKYRNDEFPTYYTSANGTQILFDSYDSSVEDTLTSVRTYGYGQVVPQFQMTDTFVPVLNPKQFQLLLQEAKAQAFVELKQTANEKAERKARRHRILAFKSKGDAVDNRSEIKKRKGFGRF